MHELSNAETGIKTVKIYTLSCYQGYSIGEEGESFSLTPWGNDTVSYKGYDDGGVGYILPDGFHLGYTVSNELLIWDADDDYCMLVNHNSNPAIITKDGIITLQKA